MREREREREKEKDREREYVLFLHLFVLSGPSMDWMMPTHIGEGRYFLLSLLIQMLISEKSDKMATVTLTLTQIVKHKSQFLRSEHFLNILFDKNK